METDNKDLLTLLYERYSDTTGLQQIDNPMLYSIDSITARESCRTYENRPVDSALVDTLCAVALAAPTKNDLQQRDIIVLEDPAQRRHITSLFPDDPWIAQAPVLLIFVATIADKGRSVLSVISLLRMTTLMPFHNQRRYRHRTRHICNSR